MSTERPARVETALACAHLTAHELLAELATKVDAINPETANWGDVGDLGYINEMLRRALGHGQ